MLLHTRKVLTLFFALLALTLAACSTLMVDPLEQLREANKRNLQRVVLGHTRMEVESIMGDARAGGGLPEVVFGRVQYLAAKNPMREEHIVGADGAEYDVLFYYTDLKERDDKITDDELTPVVLRDGKVAGIGYRFLGGRVPKYRELQ
jgi:uncharacterized protein DUF3192